jgi:hypothetical protein
VSDLIGKAFAALGEAPTSRELELVAAALEDEADTFWLAANDRAAFAALAEVALEHGSSGFVALDLVMTITTGNSPPPWAKTLGNGASASGGDCR